MPTLDENRKMFETFEWAKAGDEWSSEWGGTSYLWYGTVFPRIQAFLPTGNVLEIAPGFGRCTQYLAPLCDELTVVDISEKGIDYCRKRFEKYSHIRYFVNDGKTLEMVPDGSIDFIFSWDSLVHVESDIMSLYVPQIARKLKEGGFGFIHHSNLGAFTDPETGELTVANLHWRAKSMSAELFRSYCKESGLKCLSQEIINWGGGPLTDCFSLFARDGSSAESEPFIVENPEFMKEAYRMAHVAHMFNPSHRPVKTMPPEGEPQTILEKLERDNPMFHDDGKGGRITWYSNKNLLALIEHYLKPGMKTLEIGAGYSTVIFLSRKCQHTCIVPSNDEVARIREYCTGSDIALDTAEFIIGQSFEHIPSLPGESYDLIFIDGAHRFPFPIVDWFYCAMLLKRFGLVIIDDTDIISCHILFRFMLNDPHWECVEKRENFALFRKKGNHDYPFDWQGQPFGRERIEYIEDLVKSFYPREYLLEEESTYALAIEEVEGIMRQIRDESLQIEVLADKLKRAARLIETCRMNLRTSEKGVKRLLSEIQGGREAPGSTEDKEGGI